jgi:hypothetical protein
LKNYFPTSLNVFSLFFWVPPIIRDKNGLRFFELEVVLFESAIVGWPGSDFGSLLSVVDIDAG